MALNAKFCQAGIVLLTLVLVYSESDFKTKFGAEFGSALQKYAAEMTNANMDHLAEFYKTILRDMNPTPREQRDFNLRLMTIQDMKNRIGDSITAEKLNMTQNFKGIVFWEIVFYQGTPEIKDNPKKLKVITDAFQVCAQKDNEASKEFEEKFNQKWLDLYKTIPADELEKHAEYSEINELLKKATEIDILKNGAKTKTALEEEAFRKIVEFFEFDEYKFMFQKRRA